MQTLFFPLTCVLKKIGKGSDYARLTDDAIYYTDLAIIIILSV